MHVAGHDRQVDSERLGSTLVVAASMIFAIRTARRPAAHDETLSNRDVEAEHDYAIAMALGIITRATAKHPRLFPGKLVPVFQPDDEDVLP